MPCQVAIPGAEILGVQWGGSGGVAPPLFTKGGAQPPHFSKFESYRLLYLMCDSMKLRSALIYFTNLYGQISLVESN